VTQQYLPYPGLAQGELGYMNNERLRRPGVVFQLTREHIEEYAKCSDPDTGLAYFSKKYMKVEIPDGQVVPYDPRSYQLEFAEKALKHRFILVKLGRQMGKTTAACAIILWHLLFKRRYKIALTANKLEQAIEILDRLKLAIEWIPPWLQHGVIVWRGTRIAFENGSYVQAAATSMSGIRGKAYSMIYMDEYAHIHPNMQRKFYDSVYPAISAGKETKLFITTTPNGLEGFYKLWKESEDGENDFQRVEAHWSEMPGRDEAWAAKERARLTDEGFAQEYETEFLGSSATLINGRVLARLPKKRPIERTAVGVKVFKRPEEGHQYVAAVDVSRGLGLDYQAMTMVDVTTRPWEVVATYRNNTLPPSLYHEVIHDVAKFYNQASVLVEINDVGQRVAEDLMHVDEYENVIMTQVKGKYGTRAGGGFGQNSRFGVKTTVQVKRIGCAILKQLIERDQLVINDEDILWEFGRFVGKNNTFKAEDGAHDDLVMCLVLFAWLTDQRFFKESMDSHADLRAAYVAQAETWSEEDLTPFGVIDDGHDEADKLEEGWTRVEPFYS
jgi:terminase large subunit-like protein